MAETVIHAHNLGKQYVIAPRERYKALRDSLADLVAFPFRAAGRWRRPHPGGNGHLTGPPRIWALRDVSFDIRCGEAVGIIGRNGAGKTTLLRILSGITMPTEGRVEIRGRVGSLLEVGTGFHPELSGRENIYMSGAILGMRRREIGAKLEAIAAFAEVEKFIDTPVKRYSSGMYVRLAFAVAAHLEPDILLVDEVLAVGDAAFQKKCLGKMNDVATEGRTVLFVSHNMAAIMNLTRTCMWLDGGQVADMGNTESVVRAYLAKLTDSQANPGWCALDSAPHTAGRRDAASLTWVKTLNKEGRPTAVFLEGEPIRVEVGFRCLHALSSVELACNIRTVDGGSSLFVSPSGQRNRPLSMGEYAISTDLHPNHLKAGVYTVALYLFVGGQKEDVVNPAIQVQIEPHVEPGDNPFHMRWGTGFFRFDYPWSEITPSPSRHVHS
ncbi:MAG: ABC transporter ATP-binding protein [Nitrospirae bacterium]|nr:ABC transporter ATP-binding protein [Nitrospirota bacterium]